MISQVTQADDYGAQASQDSLLDSLVSGQSDHNLVRRLEENRDKDKRTVVVRVLPGPLL